MARYLLLLLGVALLSGPLLYFTGWAGQVASCRTLTRPGAYLAYCEHPLYGSYEHEAYALGMQPASIRAMQQADVLFFGNSRLQFGFSTPAVDAFFAARSVRYHLLGFGYGESSPFIRILLRRYHPAPRLVIINADPFFQLALSPAAEAIAAMGDAAWLDAARKRLFNHLHPLLCTLRWLCPESQPAVYRDTATGQWIWHAVLLPRDTVAMAVGPDKASRWSEAAMPGWQREAERVLAALPVPRACIILTAVPTPQVDAEGMATALGRSLGLPVVLPRVDGLTTADTSHLSADSAARWSAAFLAAAAPAIDACLAAPPAAP